MTTVAAKPAAPGSWWLVLLGGMAVQAARVAEADRARAALLATVSHDLRAPLAAAKAAGSGLRAGDARPTTADHRRPRGLAGRRRGVPGPARPPRGQPAGREPTAGRRAGSVPPGRPRGRD